MPRKKNQVDQEAESKRRVQKFARRVRREVNRRLGSDSTYEQRRDAAAQLMSEVLWQDEDGDLRENVTEDEEVDVDGKRYRRLSQSSSAMYYGRWGPHEIKEPLYREVGVHNGPTLKPLELRVGVIARHMLPDFARIVGELSADRSSREVERTLRVVGMVPPGRAFVERRSKQMAEEVVEQIVDLERAAREAAVVPVEVASISCGLDRFSVRMSEPVCVEDAATERSAGRRRTKPYQRKPPAPKEYHYRKAWVGSTTIYDIEGNELHTWRYAAEADADVKEFAERAAADVAWVLGEHPGIPVHCIQDAAPELRALPEALARVLPANEKPREFVDFEHLMDYLDEVVDACEPEGDPHDMKGWYRSEFLRDDGAVDRIWKNLRAQGKRLRPEDLRARDAVAKALRYIRNRKDKMRYASSYAANLAIGSGATELRSLGPRLAALRGPAPR